MLVLLGQHQGERSVVLEILKDKFLVRIELPSRKEALLEYEHVSKYAG